MLVNVKSKAKRIVVVLAVAAVIVPATLVGLAVFLITHRVEGRYFDSAGTRIHYTSEGSGEAVILIHGFAVNADLNWRRAGITKELTKDFRVVAMDLRGHGLSDKPRDPERYGVEMAEDVARLMDHLEIRKAHIVGYSLGGFLALKLAAIHPDRLLTVSALGAGWEDPNNSHFLNELGRFASALESGKGIGPLASGLDPNRRKPGFMHTAWVRIMTGCFNDKQALIGVLKGIPKIAITEDQLRELRMPVLSIVGENDPLRVGAEAMKGRVSDHTLILIKGADHLRTPTNREFLSALRDFLKRHSADNQP